MLNLMSLCILRPSGGCTEHDRSIHSRILSHSRAASKVQWRSSHNRPVTPFPSAGMLGAMSGHPRQARTDAACPGDRAAYEANVNRVRPVPCPIRMARSSTRVVPQHVDPGDVAHAPCEMMPGAARIAERQLHALGVPVERRARPTGSRTPAPAPRAPGRPPRAFPAAGIAPRELIELRGPLLAGELQQHGRLDGRSGASHGGRMRNGQHAARRASDDSGRHAADEHSRDEAVAMASGGDQVGVDAGGEGEQLGGRISLQLHFCTVMSFGTRSCSRVFCSASPASCLYVAPQLSQSYSELSRGATCAR